MAEDCVIILSDDSNGAGDKFDKAGDKDDGNYSVIRDNVTNCSSDFSFPDVRLSEINFNPGSKRNSSKVGKFNDSSLLHEGNSEEIILETENLSNNKRNKNIDNYIQVLSNSETKDSKEKEVSDIEFPDVNFENNCYLKNTDGIKNSESDSDYESQCAPKNKREQKRPLKKKQVDIQLSDEESGLNQKAKEKKSRTRKKKASLEQDCIETSNNKCSKSPKKRGPKAASKTSQKDCIKLMEVILDKELKELDFFNDFLKASEENDIKLCIQSQLIPGSITWKRKIEIDEEQETDLNIQFVDENQILIIWNCEDAVKHISDDTFVSVISNIKSMIPNKKLSLVIYKIQSYFKYLKSTKGQAAKNKNLDSEKQKKNKAKTGKGFSNYPKISRKKFEECLVEIQILFNASSRLIESSDEMITLIHQYTKSLAQLPFKMEKEEKLSELDWCISCDNKDSVKVDKDGNGLTRLWQQQLCQFSLTSLEISEAISAIYKSPSQLIEAYRNCSESEGEMLLKDISIRRNGGILTSSKKIGPELSKKVFTMFTAKDGEICLNE